jgi:hypothetical protein
MDENQIRERLAKIKALFQGATTDGERVAAEAAMQRINLKMAQAQEAPVAQEMRFSMRSWWSLRLFMALCRSKNLRPYRYARMRHTSVCVKVDQAFLDHVLWPEFQQMDEVLNQYLDQLAAHIISECINPDKADADLVAGLPAPSQRSEHSA